MADDDERVADQGQGRLGGGPPADRRVPLRRAFFTMVEGLGVVQLA